jgi:hypothetical protein
MNRGLYTPKHSLSTRQEVNVYESVITVVQCDFLY